MSVADELRAAGLPDYAVAEGVSDIEICASCQRDEARVPEHVRELIRRWLTEHRRGCART